MNLDEKIEDLRQKLYKMVISRTPTTDTKVVSISSELDKLILLHYELRKNKETPQP